MDTPTYYLLPQGFLLLALVEEIIAILNHGYSYLQPTTSRVLTSGSGGRDHRHPQPWILPLTTYYIKGSYLWLWWKRSPPSSTMKTPTYNLLPQGFLLPALVEEIIAILNHGYSHLQPTTSMVLTSGSGGRDNRHPQLWILDGHWFPSAPKDLCYPPSPLSPPMSSALTPSSCLLSSAST